MALVTYLIRVLPLTLIRKEIKNRVLRSFLYYVPYVTLSVMTFPAILSATEHTISGAVGLLVAALLLRSFLDMSYFRKLGKQVDAILPLLHEDPDQYIEKLNAIMGEPSSLGLKQSKNINLAAAYCQKGAYRIAADLLEKLEPVEGSGIATSRRMVEVQIDHSWDHMLPQANEVFDLWKSAGKTAGDALRERHRRMAGLQ